MLIGYINMEHGILWKYFIKYPHMYTFLAQKSGHWMKPSCIIDILESNVFTERMFVSSLNYSENTENSQKNIHCIHNQTNYV